MGVKTYQELFKAANFSLISLEKIFAMVDLIHPENLSVPKNMQIEEQNDNLSISYSWFKFKYFVFFIITPLSAYVLIQSEYVQGNFNQLSTPAIAILMITMCLMYYCLARLINTTKVDVNHFRIAIHHGPLPLKKSKVIQRDDLAQLFVTKHRKAHRYYLYSTTYQVKAILKNDRIVTLLGGIYEPDQGRFIERKIEHFLGIKDIEVEGEIEK